MEMTMTNADRYAECRKLHVFQSIFSN